ncbi:MAG TPA: PQQ-binding-like beta-propeller repeat protein [Gemmataceae bacterium]|nr:PQQ-binding-like beta-propeller repeat protein [Gemmataceae bacterium]
MTPHLLECRDLDGDGTPEVLLAFTSFADYRLRKHLVLAVVSLKDGKTRWRTTLVSPSDASGSVLMGLRTLRPGLADLDGDGVLDVVTWAVGDDGMFEVRALSGRDGATLWRQSLSRTADTPLPAVNVGDLGGRPVVVVDEGGKGEVLAFDGAGERLWGRKVNFSPHDGRQRPTPVFLDLAGGERGVCLSGLWMDDSAVMLDAQGRELQHVGGRQFDAQGLDLPRDAVLAAVRGNPLDSGGMFDAQGCEMRFAAGLGTVRRDPLSWSDYVAYFWCLPRGAGGECDLLSVAAGKLRLTRGGIERKHLVWEWPLPGGSGELLDVLGEGERTTVVVRSGKTAHGLDGTTGRERWRCIGPCPPTGLLRPADPAAPPLVLFAEDDAATTCRRALEVGPDGRYLLPAGEPINPEPLPEDPRLRVPLPWWQALHELSDFDWPVFLLVQVGVILVIALGWSAAWVFRRGAWVIGLLLCLLLLAVLAPGVWLTYLRFGGDVRNLLGPPPTPLVLALLGLPVLVFAGRAVAWAVQGRWRRVGLLLAGSVLVTLPLAALLLWIDGRNLGPTQHYATDGWYSGWVMGAYATGALLVLGWLLRAAFRVVRRMARWAFRLVRGAKALPAA